MANPDTADYFPARKESTRVNQMKLIRTGFNRKLTDWNQVKEIKNNSKNFELELPRPKISMFDSNPQEAEQNEVLFENVYINQKNS